MDWGRGEINWGLVLRLVRVVLDGSSITAVGVDFGIFPGLSLFSAEFVLTRVAAAASLAPA